MNKRRTLGYFYKIKKETVWQAFIFNTQICQLPRSLKEVKAQVKANKLDKIKVFRLVVEEIEY